jgi:hypothetical protein
MKNFHFSIYNFILTNTGSLRDREKLPSGLAKTGAKAMTPMIYVPPIEGQRRSSSMRDKSGRNLPTSPLAAGILRQQSVATPTGNFVHRTVIPHVTSSVAGACMMDPTTSYHSDGASDSEVTRHSNPLAIGAKCKPRLTRQIAVQDDVTGNLQCPPSVYNKCVSFNTANVMVLPNKEDQRNYCPLHSPRSLQGVWESSIEEDYDEENDDAPEEPKKKSNIDKDKIFSVVASIYTNRDKNRLGLSGFIPRKLSTISSRSCSINPDNEAGTDEYEIVDESQQQPGHSQANVREAAASALMNQPQSVSSVNSSQEPKAFKSSNELLNVYGTKRSHVKRETELSKSDNDLYHKSQQPKSARKSIGSIVRLIVTPEAASSSTILSRTGDDNPSSSIEVGETRFGADMVQLHPRPDHFSAIQSPESQELEGSVKKGNQKELDEDSSHQEELDPLMQ